MPKSFNKDKKKDVSENEIEKQIRLAENHQTAKEDQEEDQDQVEAQISGSDNIWDSQLEMEHITNKVTRDKN